MGTREVRSETLAKVALMTFPRFDRKKPVATSQMHMNTHPHTSKVSQLHPLLPFLPAELKGRRWATAAAKQQITRGLIIPRRASYRSTQLESLHLNH